MGKGILDDVLKATIEFMDSQGNKVSLDANATRRQYAPDATDKEWEQFVDTIEANGLDPRRKEVYFTKYNTKDGPKVGIITGYTVYLARAMASGKLAKIPEVRVEKPDPKNMETWYGEVDITRTDMEGTATWSTPMKEVNKHQALWNIMPEFMLKKTTGPQGLRYYLADVIGGLPYTAEELTSGIADTDKQELEGNIQPSGEERKAKDEAGIKYLDDLTVKIGDINEITVLEKLYSKNKKVYESSEMKDIILALFATRKHAIVYQQIAEISGFEIDDVYDYVNPEMFKTDLIQEVIVGNADAISKFKADMASYLKASAGQTDEGEIPEDNDSLLPPEVEEKHNPGL